MIAQLSNLDKQGLQQATKSAIGMASVFKVDLHSAATMVAKAMAGSTAALSRYGIKVDDSTYLDITVYVTILENTTTMYQSVNGDPGTFSA